jgi:undecaprenyl-diphosphatase
VHHRAGWLNPVFEGLSWIGTEGAIWIVLAAVLAALWRRPGFFLQLVAADLIADALSYGLRDWIGRDRPPLAYPRPKPLVAVPHTSSFPSGHAATAFACATVLAFALPRYAMAFFVLAAAIAFSRVYVGVHYPLDVIGGAVLGVVVAIALRWLVGALPRSLRGPRAG